MVLALLKKKEAQTINFIRATRGQRQQQQQQKNRHLLLCFQLLFFIHRAVVVFFCAQLFLLLFRCYSKSGREKIMIFEPFGWASFCPRGQFNDLCALLHEYIAYIPTYDTTIILYSYSYSYPYSSTDGCDEKKKKNMNTVFNFNASRKSISFCYANLKLRKKKLIKRSSDTERKSREWNEIRLNGLVLKYTQCCTCDDGFLIWT